MEGRLFHVPLHQVDVKADVWIGSSHARTHVPLRWIASRNDSETTQAIIVTEPKSFLGKKKRGKTVQEVQTGICTRDKNCAYIFCQSELLILVFFLSFSFPSFSLSFFQLRSETLESKEITT